MQVSHPECAETWSATRWRVCTVAGPAAVAVWAAGLKSRTLVPLRKCRDRVLTLTFSFTFCAAASLLATSSQRRVALLGSEFDLGDQRQRPDCRRHGGFGLASWSVAYGLRTSLLGSGGSWTSFIPGSPMCHPCQAGGSCGKRPRMRRSVALHHVIRERADHG